MPYKRSKTFKRKGLKFPLKVILLPIIVFTMSSCLYMISEDTTISLSHYTNINQIEGKETIYNNLFSSDLDGKTYIGYYTKNNSGIPVKPFTPKEDHFYAQEVDIQKSPYNAGLLMQFYHLDEKQAKDIFITPKTTFYIYITDSNNRILISSYTNTLIYDDIISSENLNITQKTGMNPYNLRYNLEGKDFNILLTYKGSNNNYYYIKYTAKFFYI